MEQAGRANEIIHLRRKMLFRDFYTLSERLKLLTHPNQGDKMHAETKRHGGLHHEDFKRRVFGNAARRSG